MKTKSYFILAATLLLSTLLLTQQACKKEEQNQPPTCKIITPNNGQEITKGEAMSISVDASDSDGTIKEVCFFIDDVGKSSATTFPFNYIWDTDKESLGPHTIKATSTDNTGDNSSDEIMVTIIENINLKPIANFTATPTSGSAPFTVKFTDQSTNNPTEWQWDFGEGETSTEQNPTHAYISDGRYTVTLIANNEYGSDTATKNNYIYVGNGSGDTFTDPRDGQTYNIVTIDSQTWFAENLNYETANSWWYDNSSANGDVYGRLYMWNDAITACPAGWHLPSDDEWKTLEIYLGMGQYEVDEIGWRGSDEGRKLKSTGGWYNTGNGTDEVGFSALPGGIRSIDENFYGMRSESYWWSATEYYDTLNMLYRRLSNSDYNVYRDFASKEYGFSVRCIQD